MRALFRVWLDGQLLLCEETWLTDLAGVPALADRHSDLVAGTDRPWLAEVEFPELPPGERYFRFGTDTAGMSQPLPMPR